MENISSSSLNTSTGNSTEPLNRSISKLRPPRPIMRTNSSSALLTDLANFAAGIGSSNSDNGSKKDNTLTLEMLEPLSPKKTCHSKPSIVASNSSTNTTAVGMAIKAGMKRKAEANAIHPHARTNPTDAIQRPVRGARVTKANIAPVTSMAPSRRLPGQPNLALPNNNQSRPPSSASVTTKGTMARRPPVTTSIRPTAASGPEGRAATSANSRTTSRSSAKRIRAVSTANASSNSPNTSLSTESQETGSTAGDHSGARYQILTSLLNQFSLYSKKKRPAWDTKGRLEEMDGLIDAVYRFVFQEARRSKGHDCTENEESPMTNDTNTTNLWGAPRHLKRPARDTKQHVQEASLLIDTMHQKLRCIYKASQELENTERAEQQQHEYKEESKSRLMVKKSENEALRFQEQALKQQVEGDVSRHSQDVQILVDIQSQELDRAQSMQTKLLRQKETLESQFQDTSTQYDSQLSDNSKLRSAIANQSSACLAFDSENRTLKSKIERMEDSIHQRESNIADLERCVDDMESFCDELSQRIRSDELTRVRLYNTIADLRGNVRVFCRVQPFSSAPTSKEACIRYPDLEEREIEIAFDSTISTALGQRPLTKFSKVPSTSAKLVGLSPHSEESMFPFQFDHVFKPESTLEQVYNHIVPTVEHVFAGSPVTIFGYGPPQLDKSFALEAGLIPLVVQDVCQRCQELERTKGWQYAVTFQQLGISDEVLYDLFTVSDAQKKDTTMGNPKSQDNTLLEIRHDKDGTTTVSGLSTIVLNYNNFSMQTVVSFLDKASRARSNITKSSRCHSVYMIHLSGKRKDHTGLKEESMNATLSLVELTGHACTPKPDKGRSDAAISSLPSRTQGSDTLDDLDDKDQSLACLMQVLFALSNKESRIPFRNSKLTNLLQYSFAPESASPGGSGITPKILMIAHVSPLDSQLGETLNTLRIATKINGCVLGTSGGNGTIGSSNGNSTSITSLGTSKGRRA